MMKSKSGRLIIPDEATPRFYGRLTLVICAGLLMSGTWMLSSYLLTPVLKPVLGWTQSWTERVYEEGMKRRLDILTAEQVSAQTVAEKDRAAKNIADLLAQPRPNFNTMTVGFGGAENAIVRNFGIFDSLAGIALNVVLIVGAAGMIGLREWGRKTVVVVSALKIARIALFGVAMFGWVLPAQIRAMKAHIGPTVNVGPNSMAIAATSSEFLTGLVTASVVGYGIAALIYPVLLLVMLTKPRVKAACRSASLADELA